MMVFDWMAEVNMLIWCIIYVSGNKKKFEVTLRKFDWMLESSIMLYSLEAGSLGVICKVDAPWRQPLAEI